MSEEQNAAGRETVRQRRARVLYSYTPANDDELELQVNDIIRVIEEVEEGWWRGILKGKEGVFPSNFVVEDNSEVFEPSKVSEKQEEKDGSVVDATDGAKLSSPSHQEIKPKPVRGVGLGNIFQDGIKKLTPVESSADKKPILKKPPPLPANAENAPKLPPKPVREQAQVIYPYEAQNDDELTLKKGDIITIITKEVEDKGWWKGELNGQIGVFPDNFVELVRIEEVQLRRPERPEKPSMTVILSKSNVKPDIPKKPVSNQDFSCTERTSKIPPPKPPAPDLPKKDEKLEKPTPPLPGKNPQLPPPLKKPQRSSLGSKPNINTSSISPVASSQNSSSPTSSTQSTSLALTNGTVGLTDDMKAKSLQENQDSSIDELTLDVIESSPEKLTHLAASRAKAPNRRPPSRIFMNKENDKENGDNGLHQPAWLKDTSKNQDKRSSQVEPILSDKAQSHTAELPKSSPQHKPAPPAPSTVTPQKDEENKPVNKSPASVSPTKELSPTASVSSVSKPEPVNNSSNVAVASESVTSINDLRKEIQTLKENTVSKEEFAELQKQIETVKETIESQRNYFSNLVFELMSEIDEEKKLRMALEVQLERIKKLTATV
ncbi:SH3 domain-containing kinase-binding protein 1-like [Centruroides vittatus]|uniref:SH3 domain-containing kinase-binding protein 1-like n=1 Tax=Centruroides vittatus TaxID=120091 RepID=UPI0035103E91